MITAIDNTTALVLIDLQKGIVNKNTEHIVKAAVDASARLVEAFRKAGQPVVLVNLVPVSGSRKPVRKDLDTSQSLAKMISAMPDFSDIADELNSQASDIYITKHTWSAFCNTALHDELQKRGVSGIVLGGVSTSIGVEGTARAAAELGYNISFASDAVADMNPEAHQNSIKHIFPRLGEVGTAADIIENLPAKGQAGSSH